jgi:predicted DNA binding CopG/RHH family protein
MNKYEQHTNAADDWEEGSAKGLGQDERFVKRAEQAHEASLDHQLELQMISIRLQKSLIQDLKLISEANGIGYQPLIRDVLSRFARNEIQQMMRDKINRKKLKIEEAKINHGVLKASL